MADFAYRPGTNPAPSAPGGGGGGGGGSAGPSSPTGRAFAQRFPVYQIDFTAVASGKKIAGTKRRIRWRFGFPNRDALEAGETGTACRGEEHDVTIVWSITSGKRLILADGQEVHYSMARAAKLEFSWTMRGNHVLKVVAHAGPQMSSTPGFRQYDLYIDGQSFFSMPKVYELGIKGPIAAEARAPGVIDRAERSNRALPPSSSSYRPGPVDGAPMSREEEEIELAKAISASLEESRQHLKKTVESHRAQDPNPPAIEAAPSAAAASGSGDLLDFVAPEPAPAPPAPALPPSTNYAPAPPQASFVAPPPAQPVQAAAAPGAMVPVAPQPGAPYGVYGGAPPAPQYGATPPAPVPQQPPQQQPAYAPAPPVDQFAPQPAPAAGQFAPQTTEDPFAPKAPPPPTFNDVTSSILGQYGGLAPAPVADATQQQPAYVDQQQQQQQQQFQQPPGQTMEAPAPFDGGFAPQEQAPAEQYNGTSGENGVAAPEAQFAQLSDNTEPEPADEDGVYSAMKKLINLDDISSPVEAPLTMNPFEDEKNKKSKTKAIPPVAHKFGNPSASLSEMQTIKTSASGEKKLVMSAPLSYGDASAGALVVSGVQNGGYSVPPPINKPTGFGVGATMNGGGYGGGGAPQPMQQQQQPPMQQGYGAPPPMQQQQQQQQHMYGAPPGQQPMQQPGYGAPPPQQQPPMQQPMYGGQQPPPPPQPGYSNYSY